MLDEEAQTTEEPKETSDVGRDAPIAREVFLILEGEVCPRYTLEDGTVLQTIPAGSQHDPFTIMRNLPDSLEELLSLCYRARDTLEAGDLETTKYMLKAVCYAIKQLQEALDRADEGEVPNE